MWGLPEDFDGSFFVGCVATMVSFTTNTVSLRFDRDVAVMVESSFDYRAGDYEEHVVVQPGPIVRSSLMQLLGRSVISVEASESGTLTLTFDGGHMFRCFDDSPQYESYHVYHGDIEIHV